MSTTLQPCSVTNCVRKLRGYVEKSNLIPYTIERNCPHANELSDCPEQTSYDERVKVKV